MKYLYVAAVLMLSILYNHTCTGGMTMDLRARSVYNVKMTSLEEVKKRIGSKEPDELLLSRNNIAYLSDNAFDYLPRYVNSKKFKRQLL